MATKAVILIPAEPGESLPSYLFSPVVGLPLLNRLIFSLWRAGIDRVSLVASADARLQLEKRLARMKGPGGDTCQIYCQWPDLWAAAPEGPENAPSLLVMTANVLATPKFLADFARFPVPPGQVALAVTGCPANAMPGAHRGTAYQAVLENHLVTSLKAARGPGNHCALSLVLFSPSAWRDWQSWFASRNLSEDTAAASEDAFFPYLARQAREKRLLGVESDSLSVGLVHNEQDARAASARLIAATQGSPWGEGYLESSVNRRLARKILLHLAVSAPGLNPNLITVSDLLLGLAAVAGFLTGNYWASLGAALLLPLVIVLDTLDGLLARLTFQETPQGLLLDLYGDTLLNLLIFFGIAVGQYRATGRPLFLFMPVPLTIGFAWCWRLTNPLRNKTMETVLTRGPAAPPELRSVAEKAVNETTSRDFFYLILLCALLNLLDWFIISAAVGINLFALFLARRRRPGR